MKVEAGDAMCSRLNAGVGFNRRFLHHESLPSFFFHTHTHTKKMVRIMVKNSMEKRKRVKLGGRDGFNHRDARQSGTW